jgi:hypothetical protein
LETKTKPKHNKYDNIFEIRQKIDNPAKLIDDLLEKDVTLRFTRAGKAVIVHDLSDFLKHLVDGMYRIPITKVLIPELDGKSGSIYYVLEKTNNKNYIFRGTYGYAGTGCHESALVEAACDILKIPIELHSGDILIRFCTED